MFILFSVKVREDTKRVHIKQFNYMYHKNKNTNKKRYTYM